jgi:heme/copper-type cytochrome/quinol oxidase subunit 4
MKKLQKFLKNHLRKIILWIIIALAVIHFIVNFELVQNTNLINGYILIITMSAGLVFFIWLAFLMHIETAKDLEKFLLRNLTTACFLLIMVIGFHGILWNLEKNFTLTAIGAIIVFWYWYKTYERDKEIDLIKNFSERYHQEFEKTKLWEYTWIINIWYEEYFLYNRWYISELLWKEWDYWIYRDLQNFLEKDYEDFTNGKEETFFYALMPIHQLWLKISNRKNMVWNQFSRYIFSKIETCLSMDRWLLEKIFEWDNKKIDSKIEWQESLKQVTYILTK